MLVPKHVIRCHTPKIERPTQPYNNTWRTFYGATPCCKPTQTRTALEVLKPTTNGCIEFYTKCQL